MPRVHTLVAIALLAPAGTIAAQASASHAGHASPKATPQPGLVQVTMQEYAFIDVPDTIPAGMTTLRALNKGKEPHHAIVVRFDEGKSLKDLMATKPGGPPPAWMHILGGPQAGADVAIDLAPGSYALLCMIPSADGAPHMAKGMMKAFTVVPSTSTRPAPKADVEVTMLDYDWKFSRPLTAGRQTLKLVTAPGQPHELVIMRLLPGKTPADLGVWEKDPSQPPPFDWMSGIAPAEAGVPNYWTVDLEPGRYLLVCFIPDAKDGKPHLAHGMTKLVELR